MRRKPLLMACHQRQICGKVTRRPRRFLSVTDDGEKRLIKRCEPSSEPGPRAVAPMGYPPMRGGGVTANSLKSDLPSRVCSVFSKAGQLMGPANQLRGSREIESQ